MNIKKMIIKALGGKTSSEIAKERMIAYKAQMALLAAEEENKELRRRISADRMAASEWPGRVSAVSMQKHIDAVEAKCEKQEKRIEELERALLLSENKNKDMKKILSLSTIKGGRA